MTEAVENRGRNYPATKRGFNYDFASGTLDVFANGVEMEKFGGIDGIYTESSTQEYEIGTRRVVRLPTGGPSRTFHYCYAATGLYGGMGAQDGGVVGLFTLAAGTQAAGSTSITIPDTDTDHVANWWKGGYIAVEAWGPWYREITASTASDGSTCDVTLDYPTLAALTTNRVQVVRNPYAAVTRGMTLGAGTAKIMSHVCVPPIVVTSGYYFWGQTWGPVAGCPVAFFGDLEFERAVILFDTDGAVASRFAYTEKYQDGGYLMGRYTASTDHRIPIYFLMLAP